MSGVAAYSVGFFLPWPHTHTHTRLQLMHYMQPCRCTLAPAQANTYTITPTSGKHNVFPESLAATIEMSQKHK